MATSTIYLFKRQLEEQSILVADDYSLISVREAVIYPDHIESPSATIFSDYDVEKYLVGDILLMEIDSDLSKVIPLSRERLFASSEFEPDLQESIEHQKGLIQSEIQSVENAIKMVRDAASMSSEELMNKLLNLDSEVIRSKLQNLVGSSSDSPTVQVNFTLSGSRQSIISVNAISPITITANMSKEGKRFKSFHSIVDSGSAGTIATMAAAKRAGVTQNDLENARSVFIQGVSGSQEECYEIPFYFFAKSRKFRIDLIIYDKLRANVGYDVLLGRDYIKKSGGRYIQ